MKTSSRAQSATSLPRSPRDDVGARSRRYLVMMAIRIACFALMVLITPYGWYTWVFAAGAIFLPYIAVVLANVGEDTHAPELQNPERALPAEPPSGRPDASPGSPVLRIDETQQTEPKPRDLPE